MIDYSHSEDQARRAAKRVGLQALKGGRWRVHTVDNQGGFMIRDPMRNLIVAGEKFNFTADDVVEFCAEREGNNNDQTKTTAD